MGSKTHPSEGLTTLKNGIYYKKVVNGQVILDGKHFFIPGMHISLGHLFIKVIDGIAYVSGIHGEIGTRLQRDVSTEISGMMRARI